MEVFANFSAEEQKFLVKYLRIKVELKNKNESEIKYLLKISINKFISST